MEEEIDKVARLLRRKDFQEVDAHRVRKQGQEKLKEALLQDGWTREEYLKEFTLRNKISGAACFTPEQILLSLWCRPNSPLYKQSP